MCVALCLLCKLPCLRLKGISTHKCHDLFSQLETRIFLCVSFQGLPLQCYHKPGGFRQQNGCVLGPGGQNSELRVSSRPYFLSDGPMGLSFFLVSDAYCPSLAFLALQISRSNLCFCSHTAVSLMILYSSLLVRTPVLLD